MGTIHRPGLERGSSPSGPSIPFLRPGRVPEADAYGPGVGVDAVFARLIATDPFADDPRMENVTWVGPARAATVEEWAGLTGLDAAPVYVSLPPTDVQGRLELVRASVPDHPKAPRPNNPAGIRWTPAAGADALDGLDPSGLADNDLLDYAHAANRLAAFAQAMEATALAAFAARRPPLEGETRRDRHPDTSFWAAGELMAVYAIGEGAAARRMDDAETLVSALPATHALLRQGLLDAVRVRAIRHGLENVPESLFPVLEPLFLPGASRMNPASLTRKIRRLAEKHNPEPLTERHNRAAVQRRVWFTPLPDAMAQIGAVLPAVPALALFESLQAWALNAQREGNPSTALTPTGRPSRSLDNYMADCFLDLIHQAFLHPGRNGGNRDCSDVAGPDRAFLGPTDGQAPCNSTFVPRIPAKVAVEVPVMTLLGHTEEPGNLDGYGPIPADQARELAAGAKSWQRILTDPERGTRLSIGRGSHKPPADMVRLVRLRDPVCTGIGCDHPARSCDIDHTIPFHQDRYGPDGTLLPKGETSVENLRPRSRYCHRLKDDPITGWTVEPAGPGITRTITPTGREYLHSQNDGDGPEPSDAPCPF
ncbi:hypothetical protein AL755_12165 [Arthrobacter sp. ERGS1:01]|uniref:DUF222 domain-containing protein n=1 Tax=Arthrobacter sp. ERGS1:01 TaxID=1704044 RepID=UPI0006B529D8|nr:DUF222 domain-containing protein [Arthrobacter sp. ERGS1:01]ALE06049.1 hypothetical protein AL755_12165 [Arthrobacter sp. ERGS1:01]